MSLNMVAIQGRLVADPEVRNGVVKIRIAVKQSKDRSGFFNVACFQKTGEFVAGHFAKGSEILIEGRLSQNEYEKDGKKTSFVEIIANSVHFCGGRNDKAEDAPSQGTPPKDVDF